MKFLTLFTTTAFLVLTMANPTPLDAELDAPADLEKRACTSLSHSKCYGAAGEGSGVYCGYCYAVQGTDWAVGNHKYYAYQINGNDHSCCSYGYRKSCETNYLDQSQCPI